MVNWFTTGFNDRPLATEKQKLYIVKRWGVCSASLTSEEKVALEFMDLDNFLDCITKFRASEIIKFCEDLKHGASGKNKKGSAKDKPVMDTDDVPCSDVSEKKVCLFCGEGVISTGGIKIGICNSCAAGMLTFKIK